MKTILFGCVTAFLSCSAAAAEITAPPVVVAEAINAARKACDHVKTGIADPFLDRKDINGDGVVDYIIDYGDIKCLESRTFCGSAGCLTQVFASLQTGGYEKVLDENVRDLKFRKIDGKPAMVLGVHGSACEKAGAEPCQIVLLWNGRGFGLQPSFNCEKARASIEHAICADRTLMFWDAQMGGAYRQSYAQIAGTDRESLLHQQREWITVRNSACRMADVAVLKQCILQRTKLRITQLEQSSGAQASNIEPSARSSIGDGSRETRDCRQPSCYGEIGANQSQSSSWPTHPTSRLDPVANDTTDRGDIDKMTSYAVLIGRAMGCGLEFRPALERVSTWLEDALRGPEAPVLAMIFTEGVRHHAGQQTTGASPDNCSAVRSAFETTAWP